MTTLKTTPKISLLLIHAKSFLSLAKCSSQTDTYKEPSNELMKPQVETQRQTTGGSDSGQGSEADDGIRMAYHFYIPSHLCGK